MRKDYLKHQQGFSFTEIAILLLVIGLVVTMSISAGNTQLKMVEVTTTKSQLDTVKDALLLYRDKTGRFPYPANKNDSITATTYGWENLGCPSATVTSNCGSTTSAGSLSGMVPFKTLGLNANAIVDEWGNKILYVVDTRHATSSTNGPGSIIIQDRFGNNLLQSKVHGAGAIFVLVSGGEDTTGPVVSSGESTRCSVAPPSRRGDPTPPPPPSCTTYVAATTASMGKYNSDYMVWHAQTGDASLKDNVRVKSIAAGFPGATCLIKYDDTLWCGGQQSFGQFGINSVLSTNLKQISVGGKWKSYALDVNNACGLKLDNTIWCVGKNDKGALGDGTTVDKLVPVQESSASQWKTFAKVQGTTCAIKSDDTLWCWGENNSGVVGDGTTVDKLVPTQVSGGGTWKTLNSYVPPGGWSLYAGYFCAIKSDDTLWCWGWNIWGQLGDGTTVDKSVPTQVSGGGKWKTVKRSPNGMSNTCGIKMDNTLWCWGSNSFGQLGDGTNTNSSVPVQVSGGGSWRDIAVYGYDVCAIKTDNTLWCWGWNITGEVGDGTTVSKNVPTQVSGGGTWKNVWTDPSNPSVCAQKMDGTLWCWGQRLWGATVSVPTAVYGNTIWKQVVLEGMGAICGIKMDDSLWCWGRDQRLNGTVNVVSKTPYPVYWPK